MNFKIGDQVKLIQPEFKGTVVNATYDAVGGSMQALVEVTENGEVHQRWIKFDQLELVGD